MEVGGGWEEDSDCEDPDKAATRSGSTLVTQPFFLFVCNWPDFKITTLTL